MIKIGKYMLLCAVLFGTLFSACDHEEDFQKPTSIDGSIMQEPGEASIILYPVQECTLVSTDWDGTSLSLLQSKTFEVKYYSGAIYKWTVSGGLSIVGSSTSNKVTVKGTAKGTGVLSVTMDVPGNASLACGNTGIIYIGGGSGSGSSPSCACAEPSIYPSLWASGEHGYWRFHATNVTNADQIRWYGQHVTLEGSATGSYATFRVLENALGGFTVYCEVTRTCSNGTTVRRTAYYENYYGGSDETGNTGFTGICTSGSGGGGGTPIDENLK